jgi:hypothetical protein
MKRLWFSFVFLSLLLTAGLGRPGVAEAQTQVQIGAYVLRLANISQKDGSFDVDMWVWFRWKGDELKPYESFEIANGKIESKSDAVVTQDDGYNYTSVRVQATVFHDYDVRRFPLDNHVVTIEIEDQNADASTLEYVADDGIALDPGVTIPGWVVKLGAASSQNHAYPTNYGLRSAGTDSSHYSRFVLPISLDRASAGTLFKGFWIAALSVLLSLLAFRVRATDLDARFGLGVGSIFAASANAFVIADSLPDTTVTTLAEQINFLAIGTIFLSVFVSVASLRLCYRGKEDASERLDNWALAVFGIVYIAANVWIIAFHV